MPEAKFTALLRRAALALLVTISATQPSNAEEPAQFDTLLWLVRNVCQPDETCAVGDFLVPSAYMGRITLGDRSLIVRIRHNEPFTSHATLQAFYRTREGCRLMGPPPVKVSIVDYDGKVTGSVRLTLKDDANNPAAMPGDQPLTGTVVGGGMVRTETPGGDLIGDPIDPLFMPHWPEWDCEELAQDGDEAAPATMGPPADPAGAITDLLRGQ
jgi:hypothetical protein